MFQQLLLAVNRFHAQLFQFWKQLIGAFGGHPVLEVPR